MPSEFTVHHLRFEVEALTPLVLPAHAGPSIRGALFGALQRHFCPAPRAEALSAEHKAVCPVCWLMATEKPEGARGRDVPRPYTVEPPLRGATHPEGASHLAGWRVEPGQRISFGLTLFAQAVALFPYLVLAMPIMGQDGLGAPLSENAVRGGAPRRGRFVLRRIDAVNRLTAAEAPVLGEGQTLVHVPDVPAGEQQVRAAGLRLLEQVDSTGRLSLCFLTPTRIIDDGRLAHRPWPGALVRRLLERLDALRGEYAGEPPTAERERLCLLADKVRLAQDNTQWIDVHSASRRLERTTPVGGYAGTAVYEAERETWEALLPLLVWGQEIHVGKDATKGNGWYVVGGTEWQSSST